MQTAGITFHPLDLSEHGKTPAGLPLYRIVLADSRIDKVFSEGVIHELPRYEACEGEWVLEKWRSAYDLTKMTPLQWQELLDSQMFGTAQMEYPTDGDYELSYPFEGSVDPTKARMICTMIEFDQNNYTDADRGLASKQAHEAKAFNADEMKSEIIKAALTKGNS
jgi:hypothetical protein